MSTAAKHEYEFYSCPIRLDGQERYLLWFTGPRDGVWLDGDTVLSWLSDKSLRDYAANRDMEVSSEESPVYDLDRVESFVRSDTEIGVKEKLNAWNLFVDIASSVGSREFLAMDSKQIDVYNHLFYLADAAPVKDTHPEGLSTGENEITRRILSLGLSVLRGHICVDPNQVAGNR